MHQSRRPLMMPVLTTCQAILRLTQKMASLHTYSGKIFPIINSNIQSIAVLPPRLSWLQHPYVVSRGGTGIETQDNVRTPYVVLRYIEHISRKTNKQTNKQTKKQTHKQTNKQTNKQTIQLSNHLHQTIMLGSQFSHVFRVFCFQIPGFLKLPGEINI